MLKFAKRRSLLCLICLLCQGLCASNLFALKENEQFHCNQQVFSEDNLTKATPPSERLQLSSIGILIHGYHLQAEEWDNVVFGTKEHPGRVPVGVEEAVNKQASLIFWGTGGSEKDGIIESDYIFNKVLGPKLIDLADYVKRDPTELANYLRDVSILDHRGSNTMEELIFAIEECVTHNIHELILVSSPTHIARCLQEACKIKEQNGALKLKIYARACDTCFASTTAKDVTIFEPPHRGDSHKVHINQTVKGIFQFLRNPQTARDFNQALAQFIEDYKKTNKLQLEE